MILFTKIIGQELAKKILTKLYLKKHFPPLLFVGPTGVGKRTTAINFAQIVNCPTSGDLENNKCLRCSQIGNLNNIDIKLYFPIPQQQYTQETEFSGDVLDYITENLPAYRLGETRPSLSQTSYHPLALIHYIKSEMAYRPVICNYKVIIILDIHKIRPESANALLKTLEEPQKETMFILTAERISQIMPTIRSRSQLVFFRKLKKAEIKNYLISKMGIDEKQAEVASNIADGRIRNALVFLSNPQSVLPPEELIRLLDRNITNASKLTALIINNEILNNNLTVEKIISSTLFLYRQVLFYKLNLPVIYNHEVIKKISNKLSYEELLIKIAVILNALNELSVNLNRRLFLFNLLTKLRI
ncbi:MAG: AAA family ATPase [candidate division WOR-3 bacterium]|nr:AAA family ATPase [candidate division WOR-3 bacterium]MDW7987786.1 AAA family ATPase [candidate division WOR-3 bacterium]